MKKTHIAMLVTVFILMVSEAVFLTGCSRNTMAKSFGGTMKVELPAGKKLVNATWKDNEFWYLTRDMHPGETAENWEFHEKSPRGYHEGTVLIIEKNVFVKKQEKGFGQ